MQIIYRFSLAVTVGLSLGLLLSFSGVLREPVSHDNDILSTQEEILGAIQKKYIKKINHDDFSTLNIEEIFSSLDHYSEYLSEAQYKKIISGTKGNFKGIGIRIKKDKIDHVFSGSPASESGLKQEDKIIKIDGRPIDISDNYNLHKILQDKKSVVEMTILRGTNNTELSFDLVKENFSMPSIDARVIENNFCYIKIETFNDTTESEINTVLENICGDHKKIQGAVIDLRNNPGGTLESAISVSNLFLKKGVIVSAKGRDNELIFVRSATGRDSLSGLPMVAIVNNKSASAAEIFAGAMQDNKRAIIIGNSTYGKGSIQEVVPLKSGGAVILTTAKYFRPSGEPITQSGIRPDIKIHNNNREAKMTNHGEYSDDTYLLYAVDLLKNKKSYLF
tara:strand:+ start:94 stop:1269 length:1176 start_codon:yes stop_codon:yes gene_type:complete